MKTYGRSRPKEKELLSFRLNLKSWKMNEKQGGKVERIIDQSAEWWYRTNLNLKRELSGGSTNKLKCRGGR